MTAALALKLAFRLGFPPWEATVVLVRKLAIGMVFPIQRETTQLLIMTAMEMQQQLMKCAGSSMDSDKS